MNFSYIDISPQFSYSSLCLESFPCQHYVKINGQEQGPLGARAINNYCINHKLDIPEHFRCYLDDIEEDAAENIEDIDPF